MHHAKSIHSMCIYVTIRLTQKCDRHVRTYAHHENRSFIQSLVLMRSAITCGTHFGDTNEVTSMTGSPVAERRSMSSTLTSVGTGLCTWREK